MSIFDITPIAQCVRPWQDVLVMYDGPDTEPSAHEKMRLQRLANKYAWAAENTLKEECPDYIKKVASQMYAYAAEDIAEAFGMEDWHRLNAHLHNQLPCPHIDRKA